MSQYAKFHKDLNWSKGSKNVTLQNEWVVQFDVHTCNVFKMGDKQFISIIQKQPRS